MNNDSVRKMQRNCYFLLKWLIVTVVFIVAFHYVCDTFTQLALSQSAFDRIKDDFTDPKRNYEDSLINWAKTGRSPDKKSSEAEKVQDRDDLILIGALIIFRHGARTPLHLLPNLEEVRRNSIEISMNYSSL